jgi:hypothetical protein
MRGRPFNLQGGYGFLFRSEIFFRTARELEYLLFLSRFFPEFNIRLYDKNSESDYFFQQHWESEYFFQNNTLEVKWSVPNKMKQSCFI